MLVKRSSKNQVAIPKAILERAGLGPRDTYFDVAYRHGAIVLQPVEIEEKIAPEALARFEARALRRKPGDREYPSMEALITDLHRIRRQR
jgi:hypothetical protein